ncbi:MAG: hypothetical protein H0T42_22475 [Deltaproteobacteria bacterium]|nr:hypothetical protein [Deltaproteobacteria bacterium]
MRYAPDGDIVLVSVTPPATRVTKLDRDRTPRWESVLDAEISSLFVEQDGVYVVANDLTDPSIEGRDATRVFALDAATGRIEHTYEIRDGVAAFFALSSSRFDDSHDACPNKVCANNEVLEYSLARSDARALRGTSIGIGGAVLLGIGAYLLLTPSTSESHVTFNLEPGHADVAYTTSF